MPTYSLTPTSDPIEFDPYNLTEPNTMGSQQERGKLMHPLITEGCKICFPHGGATFSGNGRIDPGTTGEVIWKGDSTIGVDFDKKDSRGRWRTQGYPGDAVLVKE